LVDAIRASLPPQACLTASAALRILCLDRPCVSE